MNIFVLDPSPIKSARMQCDKHVVKMVLETAQILSTVCDMKGLGNPDSLYRPTHKAHPCVKWAAECDSNAHWLLQHGAALLLEYRFRYDRRHKSTAVFKHLAASLPPADPSKRTPHVQCMPDQYRCESAVEAYRSYYIGEKHSFAEWNRGRPPPRWWS